MVSCRKIRWISVTTATGIVDEGETIFIVLLPFQ